jgi:excisionase family DNA binding protein
MEKLVCTPNEAAKALGTSPDEIRRLIYIGEIPAYKNGTHYKIVISMLKDYIQSKAIKETAERRRND